MSLQFKIDKLIESSNLTKTGFAEIIGVSRDTVYNLNENSKLITFLKICKYFNIKLSDLIDDEQPKKNSNTKKKANVQFDLDSDDILKIDMKNRKLEILKK